MSTDYSAEALRRKGYAELNGQLQMQSFWSEGRGTAKDIKIVPNCRTVKSLADFFALLKEVHSDNEARLKVEGKDCDSLFLYRGQANVNYTWTPTITRQDKDLKREHLLCREFHRRFYELLDDCKTMLEEEVHLQHYGAGSRVMDVLEHPLIALWAACEFDSNKENEHRWGEVSIWCLDNYGEDVKAFDSSTVSVIVNTAVQEPVFSLGHIEMAYHKEHPTAMQDFIYLRDVLRRTAIVRPKFTNPRIRNQFSAFAATNLNRLVDRDGDFAHKFGVTVEQFSEYILNAEVRNANKGEEYQKPNIQRLRNGKHTLSGANFKDLTSWDLWFEKVVASQSPYTDMFDMYKYLYKGKLAKEKEWHPVIIVVPPEYKKGICKELKYLGITTSYIYPERVNVGKELKSTFSLGYSE